jgi:hypothetical protein
MWKVQTGSIYVNTSDTIYLYLGHIKKHPHRIYVELEAKPTRRLIIYMKPWAFFHGKKNYSTQDGIQYERCIK